MDEAELKQYSLFLRWINVLRETRIVLNAYKKEEDRFMCSVASITWPAWKTSRDGLFEVMHSMCCSFETLRCKNITVRTEKRIVCMLVKMSANEEYAKQVLEYGERAQLFVAPSSTRLKQCTQTTKDVGTQLMQRYMRNAIWKERLSMQLTLPETMLCWREGIERLGLKTIDGVWTNFCNLKQRALYCYKRLCCRHCLNRQGGLYICRDCRSVYFCQEGWCGQKSREDLYYGHSKEECNLLKLK